MSKAKAPGNITAASTPKRNILYIALISLAFVIVYQFIFNPKINLGGDNAGYYILGKAISSGYGFTDIHKPGNPPHTHFPPGYPAVMSVFMLISDGINFLKVVNGLFLWGSSLLLFFLLKEITRDRRLAFAGAFLMLFNMHLLSYATIMMSEIPFLFFTILGFYLYIRSRHRLQFWRDPSFYGLLLSTALAYHIRSIGIAMIAGLAAYMLFSRQFKYLAGFLGGVALLSLPWYLYSRTVDSGGGYITSLLQKNPYRPELGEVGIGGLLERFWENLQRYLAKEIPNGLFPSFTVDYQAEILLQDLWPGLLILAFIVFGLAKLPRLGGLLLWYLLGNFAIYLLWPEVWFGIRFMLPLIPLMIFLLAYGAYQLLSLLAERLKVKARPHPLLLLVFIFFFLPQLKRLQAEAESPMVAKYQNYFQLAQYAKQNLPENAVIACRKPTLFYLYARRKVTNYRSERDYTKLLDHLDTTGVSHVVIDQLGFASTARYLVPAIQANMEKFETLYQLPNPDTYLLRFNNALGYRGQWQGGEEKDGQMTLAVKEGYGIYHYPDGRSYEGQWQNNKRHGEGTLRYPDGRVRQGIWQNGKLAESATAAQAN